MQRQCLRGVLALLAFCLSLYSIVTRADDSWLGRDANGQVEVQVYFFWSLTCPHCTAAHPHIEAMAQARPWVRLHALELSRHPDNIARFEAMASALGEEASSVPALFFCGEMHVGWDSDERTGVRLRARLDACREQAAAGATLSAPAAASATTGPATASTLSPIKIPLIGSVDPGSLSLPALTLVLAGLDAFNPCAFFVLLFLLSMMAHQKSRARMLLIGGVFVTVSGLMYFAFMAAWLNVFQLFGHLAWVTLAAGALALFVGALNIKDYLWFEQGLTLSIPASKKPEIFRRTRAILGAEHLPAMLAATVFLAIAANFYELLCTAGLPMVYTRVLTLAELPAGGRYAYLAFYNLIYVLPLAAIVAVFAGSLATRRLGEREGRLLKLMSGVMMLELGVLLLVAPEQVSRIGVAFGLLALAIGITAAAARLRRDSASPPASTRR